MAKRTFASRTFKSRSFRCATWAGETVVVVPPSVGSGSGRWVEDAAARAYLERKRKRTVQVGPPAALYAFEWFAPTVAPALAPEQPAPIELPVLPATIEVSTAIVAPPATQTLCFAPTISATLCAGLGLVEMDLYQAQQEDLFFFAAELGIDEALALEGM